MTHYEKYGYCIIPTGTILYRAGDNKDNNSCLFFGLQKYVANAFKKTAHNTQIWVTKQDIKVLFMVLELNESSKAKSAIVDIYKEYFETTEELNSLDIKHFDHNKRNKLIEVLQSENIFGWLTSLEDKIDLEVCLFPKKEELNQWIELHEVIDNNNTEYEYINALDCISIHPGEHFLLSTAQNLSNSEFKNYEKMMEYWILEEVKKGVSKEQARHYFLDLRLKMKL